MSDELDDWLAQVVAENDAVLAELLAGVEPRRCEVCGVALDVAGTGRWPRFCSAAHRQRAHRARRRREEQG